MLLTSHVVFTPQHRKIFIVHGGKTKTPWRFYLDFTKQNYLSNGDKRHILRHDADASKLFKDRIECRGCLRHLRLTAGQKKGAHSLDNWLEHKLRCAKLQ